MRWASPLGLAGLALTWLAACAPPTSPGPDAADASLALSLSPEIDLGPAPIGPRYGLQRQPAVVGGPHQFLAAWEDIDPITYESWVVASRVDLDGTPLDATGLRLFRGGSPTVAFDGTAYWVLGRQNGVLLLRRVSVEGAVLDAEPVTLVTSADDVLAPFVALSGQRGLVCWVDRSETVHCARLEGTQARLVEGTFPVPREFRLCVATDGVSAVVAAIGTAGLQANLVTAAGTVQPLELPPLTQPEMAVGAALTFDGARFVLASSVFDNMGAGRVVAVAITPTGEVSAPVLAPLVNDQLQTVFGIATVGSLVRVVWLRRIGQPRVESSALTPMGFDAPVEALVQSSLDTSVLPAIAASDGQALLAWADRRAGVAMPATDANPYLETDIYGRPFGAGGAPGDVHLVSSGPAAQTVPAAVFDGQRYLVVWADQRAGDYDVYGARLSRGGRWLDAPFVVGKATHAQFDPAVVLNGNDFLVTWRDTRSSNSSPSYGGVYGTRVSRDGGVADAGGFLVAAARSRFTLPQSLIAGDGQAFALGAQLMLPSLGRGVFVVRVDPDGQVLGESALDLGPAERVYAAAGARAGEDVLLTWSATNQVLRRVHRDGTFADAGVVLGPAPSTTDGRTAVTVGPNNTAVFWSAMLDISRREVVARRVSLSDEPLDPAPLSLGELGAFAPFEGAAMFDGQQFRAAWAVNVDGGFDVVSRTLSPEGEVGPLVTLAGTPDDERRPQLVAGEPGRALLVYARKPPGSAPHLGVRLFDPSHGAHFSTTPNAVVRCGQPYTYQPEVEPAGSYTFAWADAAGVEQPGGLTLDAATGAVEWVPTPAQRGEHLMVMWAFGEENTAAQEIRVRVECEALRFEREAGCDTTLGGAAGGVAVVWALWRRRRRARGQETDARRGR